VAETPPAEDPWTVLGLARGADATACAAAFVERAARLTPTLPAAHGEERIDALAAWSRLVAAYRACTGAPGRS